MLHLATHQVLDESEGASFSRIALTGGRIVTMRDALNVEEVIENGVVLVDGHRIEAVGPAVDPQTYDPDDPRMLRLDVEIDTAPVEIEPRCAYWEAHPLDLDW